MNSASAKLSSSSKEMVRKYLDRIGIDQSKADAMTTSDSDEDRRKPDESDLRLLLRAHLLSVPFENLSQHTHPSSKVVPEIPITNLPTLDVEATLQKLVIDRRGGFCWEINTAFCWLLRQLGYSVRMGNCYVLTPGGPVPGHLCLYVDGLLENGLALHIDPGFGDAPRVPLPAIVNDTNNTAVADPMIGDKYRFVSNANKDDNDTDTDTIQFMQSAQHLERFNAVFMRSRNKGGIGGSPMVDMLGIETGLPVPPIDDDDDEQPLPIEEEEPIYLLNFDDDLEGDCHEFREGLAVVLDDESLFAQKRMCIILHETGFDYIGNDYRKTVSNGSEVHRQPLQDEGEYRETLERVAGIRL